ncbi:MAG: hypothetical protein JO208_08120 [Alphaproteobacteria bacterium]|nr:hypothetical protein [Alphaproteobacteria bacterium]
MTADDLREERILTYQVRAEEARQQALTAKDPLARKTFERLAVAWEELAVRLKHLGP